MRFWSRSLLPLIALSCIFLLAKGAPQGGNGTAEVTEAPISSSNATLSEGKKTTRTCACEDTTEALVCASNGVTYRNACRFNCAKARVSRLRVVRQGQCSSSGGVSNYWQMTKGR